MVAGGVEVLIHSARDWIAQNKWGEDTILLRKDINNIFNIGLPSIFLEELTIIESRSISMILISMSQIIFNDQ